MIAVEPATTDDVDDVVQLQIALFDEDAGTHDPLTDQSWPREHGRADIESLIRSDDSVVLVARRADRIVGFLAGYTAAFSATKLPSTYAELRSLYVEPAARRSGAATELAARFVEWARERGCAAAHVSHYAANRGAALFYERLGFTSHSLERQLVLTDDAASDGRS